MNEFSDRPLEIYCNITSFLTSKELLDSTLLTKKHTDWTHAAVFTLFSRTDEESLKRQAELIITWLTIPALDASNEELKVFIKDRMARIAVSPFSTPWHKIWLMIWKAKHDGIKFELEKTITNALIAHVTREPTPTSEYAKKILFSIFAAELSQLSAVLDAAPSFEPPKEQLLMHKKLIIMQIQTKQWNVDQSSLAMIPAMVKGLQPDELYDLISTMLRSISKQNGAVSREHLAPFIPLISLFTIDQLDILFNQFTQNYVESKEDIVAVITVLFTLKPQEALIKLNRLFYELTSSKKHEAKSVIAIMDLLSQFEMIDPVRFRNIVSWKMADRDPGIRAFAISCAPLCVPYLNKKKLEKWVNLLLSHLRSFFPSVAEAALNSLTAIVKIVTPPVRHPERVFLREGSPEFNVVPGEFEILRYAQDDVPGELPTISPTQQLTVIKEFLQLFEDSCTETQGKMQIALVKLTVQLIDSEHLALLNSFIATLTGRLRILYLASTLPSSELILKKTLSALNPLKSSYLELPWKPALVILKTFAYQLDATQAEFFFGLVSKLLKNKIEDDDIYSIALDCLIALISRLDAPKLQEITNLNKKELLELDATKANCSVRRGILTITLAILFNNKSQANELSDGVMSQLSDIEVRINQLALKILNLIFSFLRPDQKLKLKAQVETWIDGLGKTRGFLQPDIINYFLLQQICDRQEPDLLKKVTKNRHAFFRPEKFQIDVAELVLNSNNQEPDFLQQVTQNHNTLINREQFQRAEATPELVICSR